VSRSGLDQLARVIDAACPVGDWLRESPGASHRLGTSARGLSALTPGGIAENRGKRLFGFRKNAAIAATMAGQLQIQRYAKNDGRIVHVTTVPEEAFRYLDVPLHELP
jgi:hypothetical protein